MASRSALVPLAYLNGELISFTEAVLPIYDLGVMQGATLTERLRTVRHKPYLVEEHLIRLNQSLEAVGWEIPPDLGPLSETINELAAINCALIEPHEDLSIVVFVTAGQSLMDSNGLADSSQVTVCVYSSPLPLRNWKSYFQHGATLITPGIRQLPADVIDPRIKHRSRLHWAIADQTANRTSRGSAALLLDQQGYVTETSSGNLFVVRNGQLLTPREETTLNGIAQTQIFRIAKAAGLQCQRIDLTVEDVVQAEEVFLTSSTYCVLPVSQVNQERIGTSIPGPVTQMLSDRWGDEIGLNFARQALQAG